MGRNGISRDGRRGRRLDTPWKYCWGKYPGRQAKRKNHRGGRCCSSARRRPAAGSAGAWCAAAPPPGGVRQLDRLGRGAAAPPPGGVRQLDHLGRWRVLLILRSAASGCWIIWGGGAAAPPPPGGVRHQDGHHGGHHGGHLDRAAGRRGLAPYHARGGAIASRAYGRNFAAENPVKLKFRQKF